MIYDCNYNVLNSNYQKLIDIMLQHCPKFLFIIRNNLMPINIQDYFINLFENELITIKSTNNWPGTILLDENASVYLFNLNVKSSEKLKHIASEFSSWIHPNFPEDLCFLTSKEDEFLTIITHENDAYFKFSEAEYKLINNEIPDLFTE